jgi:hypothetical protein
MPPRLVDLGDADTGMIVGRREPLLLLAQQILRELFLGDIQRETARVDEVSVLEVDAGGDQNMLDRSVPSAQPSRTFVDRFAAAQCRENVRDGFGVDVKLGDVAPDIFVGGIAEQRQLRLVGLQDRSVRSDQMQGHRAILEEVENVGIRVEGARWLAGKRPIATRRDRLAPSTMPSPADIAQIRTKDRLVPRRVRSRFPQRTGPPTLITPLTHQAARIPKQKLGYGKRFSDRGPVASGPCPDYLGTATVCRQMKRKCCLWTRRSARLTDSRTSPDASRLAPSGMSPEVTSLGRSPE